MGGYLEHTAAPEMTGLRGGVTVNRPTAFAVDVPAGESMISVGASHFPGLGGVIHFGVTTHAGETLIATLTGKAFHRFMQTASDMAVRLAAGEFDRPPVRQ